MKADPYLTLYTKVKNSWFIEDLKQMNKIHYMKLKGEITKGETN